MSYSILYNPERCMYCRACEVACKQENDIPPGTFRIRVLEDGPKELEGKLRLTHASVRCVHCGKPPCLDACPTKAIRKEADGIVLISADLCDGCKKCIEACPFEAMWFDPHRNIVEICTLCVHRVREGLEPSCVLVCPTKALTFRAV